MKIGRFSKESGISIDTLRYYDKIGLLVPKKEGGIRHYQLRDLEMVKVIDKLKHCDFTLEEIKRVFSLETMIEEEVCSDDLSSLKDLFLHKQNQVENKLNQINSANEIINGALKKLDQVLKDEQMIKTIMEGKNEY